MIRSILCLCMSLSFSAIFLIDETVPLSDVQYLSGTLDIEKQKFILKGQLQALDLPGSFDRLVEIRLDEVYVGNQKASIKQPWLAQFRTNDSALAKGSQVPLNLSDDFIQYLQEAVTEAKSKHQKDENLEKNDALIIARGQGEVILSDKYQQEEAPAAKTQLTQTSSFKETRLEKNELWHLEQAKPSSLHMDKPEPANISVQSTREGCVPKVDLDNLRVIITEKSLVYEDDKLTSESPCEDTLFILPILKNFQCTDCHDLLVMDVMKAYATFQPYWLGEDGLRHEEGGVMKDISQSFAITKHWDCPRDIDLNTMKAHAQSRLVYLDRENRLIEARMCQRDSEQKTLDITWSHRDCTPTHDFLQNRSKLKRRAQYIEKNQIHVVMPCSEYGLWLNHTWVDCDKDLNWQFHEAVSMARRMLLIEDQEIPVLENCEPHGASMPLMSTREGCVGEYVHDFEGGKSYIKKRWYYDDGEEHFITDCIQSDDIIPHQTYITGYEHDDKLHQSVPKMALFIEDIIGKIDLVRDHHHLEDALPHTYVDEKILAQASRVEGCYRVTPQVKVKCYKRPDNSYYDVEVGTGPEVRVDQCFRRDETRQVWDHSERYFLETSTLIERVTASNVSVYLSRAQSVCDEWQKYFHVDDGLPHQGNQHYSVKRYYRMEKRTETTYPDSHKTYTPWISTGQLVLR